MVTDLFEEERKQYNALKKWTYLDHATFGLIPSYATEVMKEHIDRRNFEGITVGEFWDIWKYADQLRGKIGKMIGCDADEVVYGQSSTQLINIFANGIPLKAGDNIVTTDSVYPADAYVWLNKAEQGITLRYAQTTANGISPEELMSYTDEHTRAVVICLVENRSGWRHDVKAIGKMCRERGILLIVDATQCVNTMQIDVKAMNIDMLTSSIYKWMLGLQGHGFGYIRKDLISSLSQSVCGWVGSVDRSHNSATELKLSPEAKRYELGGISFTALLGMEQVMDHYFALGAQNVEERIQALVQYVYNSAKEKLTRISLNAELPVENRSGIVIFRLPEGMNVTDDMLAAHGIRARVMHGTTIRTGFHYMNNFDDVDRLMEALHAIETEI